MTKSARWTLFFISGLTIVVACRKDEPDPEPEPDPTPTGVYVNLDQMPLPKLSDYRFFTGTLSELHPNEGVVPYDVITPLFSDYASKKKFIWMPDGTSASIVNDATVLDFPDGTVMIKNFYYDHVLPNDTRRIVETRLLYKKNGSWEFADYIWNAEQTEAYQDLEGSFTAISYVTSEGETRDINYRIPSEAECYTCHKFNDTAIPIGPKPQNLNRSYPYEDGEMNQLQKWIDVGYLQGPLPSSIETVASWTDESQSLENRWRAYVDMNCAHCHREGSHCDYRPIRLAWSETSNPDNLGICITPDEFVAPQLTHIISRSNINRSMMHYRINTTVEQYRMPLLGRTVIHEEAVALLEAYIESLEPACP